MWSQPTGSRTPPGSGYAIWLPFRDWRLLVQLPVRVLTGVLSDRPEPPPPEDRFAVLAAIAAARTADSPLLREVVAAIYASDDPHVEPEPPDAVVAACAAAGRVLAQSVPASEAAEYRRWVLRVAAVACRGADLRPDDPIGAAQRRLLAQCERALAG